MTDQQWNEFLDKLEFVQLTDRWSLLPLHWLDDELPEGTSELSGDLVAGLLTAREIDDEEEKEQRVIEVCRAHREALSEREVTLDARLTPPGSRVTLAYLDPLKPGRGDCLITVGGWDRVGYKLAELAHPGEEHPESVGDAPRRVEPGELDFQHILLFPDKGTASPRAFRSLCEKTFRQARGLGARRLVVTHLHLPQSGLADRFAAAEVVSAVRQMLRESPGITVDIRIYSHRVLTDYLHWFESLRALSRPEDDDEPAPTVALEELQPEVTSEVVDTLKNLARRGSSLANEATQSVSRWFSQTRQHEPVTKSHWVGFDYDEQQLLTLLYLQKSVVIPTAGDDVDLNTFYLTTLARVVEWEKQRDAVPVLDQDPDNSAPLESSEQPDTSEEPESDEESESDEDSKNDKGSESNEESEADAPPEPDGSSEPENDLELGDDVESDSDERSALDAERYQLLDAIISALEHLDGSHPLERYFRLLAWRLGPDRDDDLFETLMVSAVAWQDRPLERYLLSFRKEPQQGAPNLARAPVSPAGSRISVES